MTMGVRSDRRDMEIYVQVLSNEILLLPQFTLPGNFGLVCKLLPDAALTGQAERFVVCCRTMPTTL